MLERIRTFFADENDESDDVEAVLHLAAAVLLIEVAKSDHALGDTEIKKLADVLRRQWNLGEADLSGLVEVALDAADAHASLHEQIAMINRNFSAPQKQTLMIGLWEVAYADDVLHHHEELLIRRLADLMYVSHTDFVRSKHLVLESKGRH